MRYDTGLKVFDLSRLSQSDDPETGQLGKFIQRRYEESQAKLRYQLEDSIHRFSESFLDGVELKVGYIPNKPDRWPREDVMCDFFLYRGIDGREIVYRIGFKGRPYGRFHIVFGTLQYPQNVELTSDIADVGLTLARILGENFDVFCNRVGPSTKDIFHYQAMLREVPIWKARSRWPLPTILLERQEKPKLAESMSRVVDQLENLGLACDLLMRLQNGEYRVLLVPRNRDAKRPPLNHFDDPKLFGDFGVLEMCGYFVACKNEEAVQIVRTHYKEALEAFAIRWPGPKLAGSTA